MKRQRSRGRGKPLNNNPNRAYESVGPDMKVRGSAQTILERYQQAGRDAMGSGDRVLAENYLQHAEHYLRLIKSIMPNFIPRSELAIAGLPSDYDEDDDFEGG
ncbi:MAG: cytosolic protein, partial [Hyphomonadaceae bacterium]